MNLTKRSLLAPLAVALAIVLVALAAQLGPALFNTSLRFRVVDSVSGGWVWDATITLQGREIRGFFQSDSGAVDYFFTRLRPGRAVLRVTAPDYEPTELPVDLHLGGNSLTEPVRMVGLELPGLDHFTVIGSNDGAHISLELRPVGRSGQAIVNHPCMDLWVGAEVSAEVKKGRTAEGDAVAGTERGRSLFHGKIPWHWDPTPAAVFRYSAQLPLADLGGPVPPFFVVDCLILVPDPRKVKRSEIENLMRHAPPVSDPNGLASYLDGRGGGTSFRYFITTVGSLAGKAP